MPSKVLTRFCLFLQFDIGTLRFKTYHLSYNFRDKTRHPEYLFDKLATRVTNLT